MRASFPWRNSLRVLATRWQYPFAMSDAPRTPNEQPYAQRGVRLKDVRDVLGGFAGIVALIYVCGGLVVGGRITSSGLSGSIVLGELPREFLLSVGLAGVVLPAAGVTIAYVVYRGLFGRWVHPSEFRNWEDAAGSRERAKIVALWVSGTALLAAPSTWVVLRRGELSDWLVVAVVVVAAISTSVALHVRERITKDCDDERYYQADMVATMMVLVAAWATPGFVMLQAASPLAHAQVCAVGGREYHGWLIGESSAAVYIGEELGRRRVIAIPRNRVRETYIGARAAIRQSC